MFGRDDGPKRRAADDVSGGFISRGHPVGCTGIAQVYELVTQLRGRAGERQVEGARIGMHINGGGVIGVEEAAVGVEIICLAE